MQFTQIPNQYAPLGAELCYAFETGAEPATVVVGITEAESGVSLGTKRFVGVDEARFDIAPYVRRAVVMVPEAGPTGLCGPRRRVVTVVVEAAAGGAAQRKGVKKDARVAGNVAVAPQRTFLPVQQVVEAPALLTEMPRKRVIGPEESDELTLFADASGEVVVTALGGVKSVSSYSVPGPGVHLFRINMRDLPGAECVVVDAGACGRVEYAVAAPPQRAQRLAWRSRKGAVEHYTFPVEAATVVEAVKQRVLGPDGYAAVVEEQRQTLLRSACEGREVLDALAGMIASPSVWRVDKERYEAVDVVTEKAVVNCCGALGTMEIAIRPNRKIRLPWS